VTTINKVIRETAPILKQVKHVVEPALPLATLTEFNDYLTTVGITPTHTTKSTL
jgi:hypothetical protein